MILTITVIAVVSPSVVFSAFTANNCDENAAIKVIHASFNPDDLRPGHDVLINAKWTMRPELVQPVKAEFKVIRSLGPIGLLIPCQKGMGSCTVDNICTKLPNNTCTAKNKIKEIKNFKLSIPTVANMQGSYRYEVKLTDGKGQQVGCARGDFRVV